MKVKIDVKPKKGLLAKFGYHSVASMTPLARHRALMKAIRAGEPPMGLFKRLNLLMVYTKKSSPKSSKVFMEDRDWVSKKFLS